MTPFTMSALFARHAAAPSVTVRPTEGSRGTGSATVPAAPVTLSPAAAKTVALVTLSAPLMPTFDDLTATPAIESVPESGIWTVRPPRAEATVADASYWLRDLRPRG